MKDLYVLYNDIRSLHISCEFCKLSHATIKCPQLFFNPDVFSVYFQYRYGIPEFKRGPRMKFNSLKGNHITNDGYTRFLTNYKTQTSRGSIMSCGTKKNIFDFTLNKDGLNRKGQSNQYLPIQNSLTQESKNINNLGGQKTQTSSEQIVKWLECKFSVTRALNRNDNNTHESNRVYYDNQPSTFREEINSKQEFESDRSFELTPKSETTPFRDETIATSNLIDDLCEKVSSFKEKFSSINHVNSGTISHLDSNVQINHHRYRTNNIRRRSSRLRHKTNSFISKQNYGSLGTNTQTNTHNTQFQLLIDVIQKAEEKKNWLLKKKIVVNFERASNFDNYFPHGNLDKLLVKSHEMKLNDWIDLKSLECIILKDRSTTFFNEETVKHQ